MTIELPNPLIFPVLQLFADAVALISWLYRDCLDRVLNTWLKLGILLGLILVFISTGSFSDK